MTAGGRDVRDGDVNGMGASVYVRIRVMLGCLYIFPELVKVTFGGGG